MLRTFSETNLPERDKTNPWGIEFHQKLGDTNISLIGEGLLFDYIATAVAALGVGFGNEKYVYLFQPESENSENEGFLKKLSSGKSSRETLKKIHPKINFREETLNLNLSAHPPEITDADPNIVIFALKNDIVDTKQNKTYMDFITKRIKNINKNSEKKIKMFLVEADSYKGIISLPDSNGSLLHILESDKQDPSVCCAMGAATSEYLIRLLWSENHGYDILPPKLVYNTASNRLHSLENSVNGLTSFDYSKSNALIVGAGSMGNFVALNAALHGFKSITIIDFDHITEHNRNRQVLFCDTDDGYQKAEAIIPPLHNIAPEVDLIGKNFKVCIEKEQEFSEILKEGDIDIIFGCVDKIRPRLALTYFVSKQDKLIPYVDGGCEVLKDEGGNSLSYISNYALQTPSPDLVGLPINLTDVFIYLKGYSKCRECVFPISLGLVEGEEENANPYVIRNNQDEQPDFTTCIEKISPSIVTGNMAGAALSTGDSKYLLNKQNKNLFFRDKLNYRSEDDCGRLFNSISILDVSPTKRQSCLCHETTPAYLKKIELPEQSKGRYGR